MLDNETMRKIEEFVAAKPRSINEIAQHIRKSWRTADRQVDSIEKEFGTIATRTFRGGTRGALKIAYWASVEKKKCSVFQEQLELQIMSYKRKEDFSAFDIFQHVSDDKKEAFIARSDGKDPEEIQDLEEVLNSTRKQLLLLSGNLSFINLSSRRLDVFSKIDELAKKGVSIKAITRVDLAGMDNVSKMLSLNHKHAKESIEIRHREQPVRAIISDNRVFRIKEIKEPTGKMNELNKKIFLVYTITDKEWVEWLSRIFWKMFSASIDANKRIEELKKIKGV